MKRILIILSFLFLLLHASARVRLPSLVSDGMVLQRDMPVKIWGWADAGEKVRVSLIGKYYAAVTGTDGKWLILLEPLSYGGPFEMKITGQNTIVIKNILVGDVWVCSGQSNMVLPMERLKEKYPHEIATSTNDRIRQFLLPVRYNFNNPEDEVPPARWEPANPQTILRFSGTAYFFARSLYDKYKIPIGLINASAGGAPAESWLSEEALRQFPVYHQLAMEVRDSAYVNSIERQERLRDRLWHTDLFHRDAGMHGKIKWFDADYDDSGWPVMQVPGFWSDEGLNANGVVWFRKDFDIPPSNAALPARLFLGCIVDRDSVYVNGKFIGTTGYQYPPRRYSIPAGLLKAGKNSITVRIINHQGKGGFVKDKKYEMVFPSSSIDLEGLWKYRLGAAAEPLPGQTFFYYRPSGLFNSMIAPLTNYSIKGVIWYQGEGNTDHSHDYDLVLSALIKDWRQRWMQGNFPFLYVQLHNFGIESKQPTESNWAELRYRQLKVLSQPNTAMASAVDLGEWNDLHPINKKDVGFRLSLAAEKLAYGKNIVHSGPIFQSYNIRNDTIVLSFTNTGKGLVARNDTDLHHFAIAAADKNFVWANAIIRDNQVLVWKDGLKNPAYVRYGWADNPRSANLYNREGLPASPFKTDE